MSRTRWAIVGVLAVVNLLVLGGLAIVVVKSLPGSAPPAPTPTLTSLPSPVSTTGEEVEFTFPATWTPSPVPSPQPTATPRPSRTPTMTRTPLPTFTPMTTATPTPVPLQNPTFDGISWNEIPGWRTGAWVTWAPGQEFDKVNAFAEPNFHQADDPRQWINGSTLQIDTVAWVKLRAWVYQTVAVEAGSTVQFEVRAVGFVKELAGGYIFRAGVDPAGRDGCDGARWGEERLANQQDGVIVLTSPKVAAGQTGQVTLCIFAETQFAQEYHAAFLDDAEMIVLPPAP